MFGVFWSHIWVVVLQLPRQIVRQVGGWLADPACLPLLDKSHGLASRLVYATGMRIRGDDDRPIVVGFGEPVEQGNCLLMMTRNAMGHCQIEQGNIGMT